MKFKSQNGFTRIARNLITFLLLLAGLRLTLWFFN